MNPRFNLLAATAAIIATLNLTGCAMFSGEGGFHGDRGDLVNADETVRYVGWCKLRPREAHCMNQSSDLVAAREPQDLASE